MIDDFFRQKPNTSSQFVGKGTGAFFFRSLLYTSIVGFISGIIFGYLLMIGWIPSPEDGFFIYGITLGIAAILSTSFVYYQVKQNQPQVVKVKHKKD